MSVEAPHVRYIFADVVGFTDARTLEAQIEIIASLNKAFVDAIGSLKTIYLPTGDGICAGILDDNVPADIHLQTALRILENFHVWSSKAALNRSAEIRVAINESVDAVFIDVNGNRNLSGAGINEAQRLMNIADGNQILVGRNAYETLHNRDQYVNAFRELKAEIKHDRVITAYQFTGLRAPFLNIGIPLSVKQSDPIEIEMIERMQRPGGYSTGGMVQTTYAASERWREEVQETFSRLKRTCNAEQCAALEIAQDAWQKFCDSERNFVSALRQTVSGTMYRVIGASIDKGLMRSRTRSLRGYLEEWLFEESSDGKPPGPLTQRPASNTPTP